MKSENKTVIGLRISTGKKVLDRVYLVSFAALLIAVGYFVYVGFDKVTSKVVSKTVGYEVKCHTEIRVPRRSHYTSPSARYKSGCYTPVDSGIFYEGRPVDKVATKWRNYLFIYPLELLVVWLLFGHLVKRGIKRLIRLTKRI